MFGSLWLFLFRCGVSFKIKYRIILWRYIFLLLLEFSMKILPWVSLSIADWRILRLLCIILRFNFSEVWLFFVQTNQTWIHWSYLNASSFKPNKTNRGCVKYLTVCWSMESWLYARHFFICTRKIIKRIKTNVTKRETK